MFYMIPRIAEYPNDIRYVSYAYMNYTEQLEVRKRTALIILSICVLFLVKENEP